MSIIKQDYGELSGGGNIKLIETTLSVGQNTIDTGVNFKKILVYLRKDDTSSQMQYISIYDSKIPTTAISCWERSGFDRVYMRQNMPNSQTDWPFINSVSGTSFVYTLPQNDYEKTDGNATIIVEY